MPDARRPLAWISRTKKVFLRFPEQVQDDLVKRLRQAQVGARDIPGAKALSQGVLKGLGIVELIADFDGDTYRAVYTAKVGSVLAVLHVFKKKSKSGIATPRHDLELIRKRYRTAVRLYSNRRDRG